MVKTIIAILLAVAFMLGGVMGYVYYRDQRDDNRYEAVVPQLPAGATNLVPLGNNWYIFDFDDKVFLFHREINYFAGLAVESLSLVEDAKIPRTHTHKVENPVKK